LFFEPGSAQLGLLLHAKEYPAAVPGAFDVNLGNCQAGEGAPPYDPRAQQCRNLLWWVWEGGPYALLCVCSMHALAVPLTGVRTCLPPPLLPAG
jgi:hypothetical protein